MGGSHCHLNRSSWHGDPCVVVGLYCLFFGGFPLFFLIFRQIYFPPFPYFSSPNSLPAIALGLSSASEARRRKISPHRTILLMVSLSRWHNHIFDRRRLSLNSRSGSSFLSSLLVSKCSPGEIRGVKPTSSSSFGLEQLKFKHELRRCSFVSTTAYQRQREQSAWI